MAQITRTAGGEEYRLGAALAGFAGAGFELAPDPCLPPLSVSPNYKIPSNSFHPLHFRVSRSNDKPTVLYLDSNRDSCYHLLCFARNRRSRTRSLHFSLLSTHFLPRFHTLTHSFALRKITTLLVSYSSALFAKNTRSGVSPLTLRTLCSLPALTPAIPHLASDL